MKCMKKLIVAGLLIFLSSVAYLKTHKFVNLDNTDENRFLTEAIIETKQIHVPGYRKAYNSSLVKYKDGYLLSFRANSFNFTTWVKKLFNHRTAYVGLVELDSRFRAKKTPQILDICSYDARVLSAPQDARLFEMNGRLLLFYNDYLKPEKGSQVMYYCEIQSQGDTFMIAKGPTLLTYNESRQRIEKNWAPFEYQGELYLVYQLEPHTVLKVDETNGLCTQFGRSDVRITWDFGELRGGTPGYLVDGKYLSFFHSSKKGIPSLMSKKGANVYFMGAYTYSPLPPFEIEAITPAPLARPTDYHRSNSKKIVYPSGLVVDGSRLHVVWGQNDAHTRVTTFDKKRLFDSLHKTTQIKSYEYASSY